MGSRSLGLITLCILHGVSALPEFKLTSHESIKTKVASMSENEALESIHDASLLSQYHSARSSNKQDSFVMLLTSLKEKIENVNVDIWENYKNCRKAMLAHETNIADQEADIVTIDLSIAEWVAVQSKAQTVVDNFYDDLHKVIFYWVSWYHREWKKIREMRKANQAELKTYKSFVKVLKKIKCEKSFVQMECKTDPKTGKRYQTMAGIGHVPRSLHSKLKKAYNNAKAVSALQSPDDESPLLSNNPVTNASEQMPGGGGCTLDEAPRCGHMMAELLKMVGDAEEEQLALMEAFKVFSRGKEIVGDVAMNMWHAVLDGEVNAQNTIAEKISQIESKIVIKRQKLQQISETTDAMNIDHGDCVHTNEMYVTELCSIKRLRTELVEKEKNVKALLSKSGGFQEIQDCVLSDQPSEVPAGANTDGGCRKIADNEEHLCKSKTDVGGEGHILMERTIVTPPNSHDIGEGKKESFGADCGENTWWETCNDTECPVDCIVDDWSEYSTCTVECDGGSQKKTRNITRHPENGGEACGDLVSEQLCNTHPCNADCKLGGPQPPERCSAPCGGLGQERRYREILTEETGTGVCPPKNMTEQKPFMVVEECPPESLKCMSDDMICTAKKDVVIITEGSDALPADKDWNRNHFISKIIAQEYQRSVAFKENGKSFNIMHINGGGPKNFQEWEDCLLPECPDIPSRRKECGGWRCDGKEVINKGYRKCVGPNDEPDGGKWVRNAKWAPKDVQKCNIEAHMCKDGKGPPVGQECNIDEHVKWVTEMKRRGGANVLSTAVNKAMTLFESSGDVDASKDIIFVVSQLPADMARMDALMPKTKRQFRQKVVLVGGPASFEEGREAMFYKESVTQEIRDETGSEFFEDVTFIPPEMLDFDLEKCASGEASEEEGGEFFAKCETIKSKAYQLMLGSCPDVYIPEPDADADMFLEEYS